MFSLWCCCWYYGGGGAVASFLGMDNGEFGNGSGGGGGGGGGGSGQKQQSNKRGSRTKSGQIFFEKLVN